MKTRMVAVAVCVAAIAPTALLYGAIGNVDTSKLKSQLKELRQQRVNTARLALEATQAAYEAETVTFNAFANASRQLADAEIDAAVTPSEELAARTKYVERTRVAETNAKAHFDMGKKGGEANVYYSAKRERESAQIALIECQIKRKP